MIDTVETIEHAGVVIEIRTEDDAENPRESWDMLGTMILESYTYGGWGRRDTYSDKDAPSLYAVEELITEPGLVYLTLATGHEGRTWTVSDPFEGGDDEGIVYVERSKWQKEFSATRLTKKLRANIEQCLRDEIETYSAWRTGDVYGFVVLDEGKNVDSCWGFYGPGTDYVIETAKEAAVSYVRERDEKIADDLSDFALAIDTFSATELVALERE